MDDFIDYYFIETQIFFSDPLLAVQNLHILLFPPKTSFELEANLNNPLYGGLIIARVP